MCVCGCVCGHWPLGDVVLKIFCRNSRERIACKEETTDVNVVLVLGVMKGNNE